MVTSDPDAQPTPSGPAGTTTVTRLAVEGMHCGSCSALIEETLLEQAGVASASVDLEAARAVVEYDQATVGLDHLCAVVADAGYTATPVG